MTDSFLHPDGWHYRCVGHASSIPRPLRRDYYFEYEDGGVTGMSQAWSAKDDCVLFERVEPPLWPWTGPSGSRYKLLDDGSFFFVNAVPPEDFAGLAERLAKQATLNEGDA